MTFTPRHLLLTPGVCLLLGLTYYVATGRDALPGDTGGRWMILIVLAFLGALAWGLPKDADL